jgi:uncharacterized protein YeaO (DUF488 family)
VAAIEKRPAMGDSGPMVGIARVYDEIGPEHGTRVLVDRLWPRGVRKAAAPVDAWCKDVAPSTELRKWYGHRPERFGEFRRRYGRELRDSDHRGAIGELRGLVSQGPVVLVTATRDVEISAARVLADLLDQDAS